MSAFKQLYKSDITVTPYTANKLWSFSYNSTPNDGYITYYTGTNTPFSIDGLTTTNGEYQSSVYTLTNQLYYQSYTGSLNTQSLATSIYYESASSQRPTSSYYKYEEGNIIKNFPSSSGDRIGLLGISSDLYGNNILPYTFRISSSKFDVTDDGKGNLISSSILIGNVFYAQGMCIITNPNFTGSLTNTKSNISFQNNYTIFEHEVKCTIKESDFNLSYNPTLQTGSITSTSASGYISYYKDGTVRNFATGSDFSPYTTTVGLYNGDNDLLVIAKLAKPILISPNTDTTFIIKYDV
jgi:hypothetical protein